MELHSHNMLLYINTFCQKYNWYQYVADNCPVYGPVSDQSVIPLEQYLRPFNVFILLNGWIYLHGVLD